MAKVVRTNLCPNPSFEVNASGWTGPVTRTVVGDAAVGAAVGRCIAPAGGFGSSGPIVQQTIASVTPGEYLGVTMRVRLAPGTPSGKVQCALSWYSAQGTYISSTAQGRVVSAPLSAGAWTTLTVLPDVAPANAVSALIIVYADNAYPAGQGIDVDACLIEAAPQLGGYFDGDTAGSDAWIYSWSGTPGASASTATYSPPLVRDPRARVAPNLAAAAVTPNLAGAHL